MNAGNMIGDKDYHELEMTAYAPYELLSAPTVEHWKKAYDALLKLVEMKPKEGSYPNTLGFLCYYGRHTDGVPQYEEARKWYEYGAKLNMIESMYKLADMMLDGLGGDKDVQRAIGIYRTLYWYCRDQLEDGNPLCKFADIALRMGRLFHDERVLTKDDLLALTFLLEARYAITKRMPYHQYGDKEVERNIEAEIESCEKSLNEIQQQELIGMGLGRVPEFFLRGAHTMSFRLAMNESGILRIHFVRKDADKPEAAWGTPVVWPVPLTMECFLTSFITLYGENVRMIWNRNPGEEVLCDHYEYDEKRKLHQFFWRNELTCKLMDGEYYLSMRDLRPSKTILYEVKRDSFTQEL